MSKEVDLPPWAPRKLITKTDARILFANKIWARDKLFLDDVYLALLIAHRQGRTFKNRRPGTYITAIKNLTNVIAHYNDERWVWSYQPMLIIGELLQNIILFAISANLPFRKCVREAYLEIRPRSGYFKDGIFIKTASGPKTQYGAPKEIDGLTSLIYLWAKERNFFGPDGATRRGQCEKMQEEISELRKAWLWRDMPATIDAVGDCWVVATILTALLSGGESPVANMTQALFWSCLKYGFMPEAIWNQIKRRLGLAPNGPQNGEMAEKAPKSHEEAT